MNLELNRVEYYHTDTTNKNCLSVTKTEKEAKRDKVIIGDVTGVIQGLRFHKGNVSVSFKTLPGSKPISAIANKNSKIHYASGQKVGCYSKKGKSLWNFTSNFTEDIRMLGLDSGSLWIAGKNSLGNYLESGEELSFYTCQDTINDILGNLNSSQGSILGCSDRSIRFIRNGKEIDNIEVEGPVTSLAEFDNKTALTRSLLYGTELGQIGNYSVEDGKKESMWSIGNQPGLSIYGATSMVNSASVTSITTSDFTKDGVDEIVVGRDDGSIEVYTFDISPEPSLVFSDNVEESITGTGTGQILSINEEDIIASTYSGKLISYTLDYAEYEKEMKSNEKGMAKRFSSLKSKSKKSANKSEQVSKLQKEIDKLKDKVEKEKEKHTKYSEEKIAVHSQYNMKESFILDNVTASYKLTIELDIPIDTIAVRSTLNVDFLTSEDSNAVVNISSGEADSKSKMIATFKCTEKTNRLSMNIRTVEGSSGTIQAFVIPSLSPKTCQTKSYTVKPLSLHERIHNIELSSIPLNTLEITGNFSVQDGLSWMRQCLPEVPDRINDEEQTFYYHSTFQETVVSCKISKGKAVFQSDNLSTLAVLKEFITLEATNRKINVSINTDLKKSSYLHVLELLLPKLEYQMSLSEKVSLCDSLEEIRQHEGSIDHLSTEYQDILDNQETLIKEYQQQPRRLEFLFDIVIKLFYHKNQFEGNNDEDTEPLREELEQFNLDNVKSYFAE